MLPKIHPSTFQYGRLSSLFIIPFTVVAIAWRVRPSLLLYFSYGCIGAAMILPACVIDTWYPTYNPFGLSTPILLCVILFGIAALGGLCSCLGYAVSKLTLPPVTENERGSTQFKALQPRQRRHPNSRG